METNKEIDINEVLVKLDKFCDRLNQMEIDLIIATNEMQNIKKMMEETNILIDAVLVGLTTTEIIEG